VREHSDEAGVVISPLPAASTLICRPGLPPTPEPSPTLSRWRVVELLVLVVRKHAVVGTRVAAVAEAFALDPDD
jgi:hypothetical protein